jgi:catechol 2,3-dioxygenase-like lactoylglutathione lyase family enzyme
MDLTCCHVMLSVSDIEAAKEFYLDRLGLKVIEVYPKFFAARAGDVRFSIFAGGTKRATSDESAVSVILRTEDIDAKVAELTGLGVEFEDVISEAPKFMRYAPLLDPDGNRLYIAQYLGDPFAAA